jgi:hypothetical protein
LAKVLFENKDGGNVTTIHNARDGVYAKERERFDSKESTAAYRSSRAGKSMKEYEQQRTSNGKVQDEYTGRMLLTEADRKSDPDAPIVDHIVSANEFHKDGGFMLSSRKKQAFASDKKNYAITNKRLNDSKGHRDLKEWEQSDTDDVSKKTLHGTDARRTNAAYERGKATKEKHLPSSAQKTGYYATNIAETGVQEGVKMGFQQALGCLLQEVVVAVFAEIKDVYNRGLKAGVRSQRFYCALRRRLTRVVNHVLSKWKDVVALFGSGAISGFFSNMITTIINMFVTTGKRLVRIIREGFFSLIRAIRLLLFPPPGMTLAQAAHAATKLIAGGVVTAAGIALEEAFEKWLAASVVLSPFAGHISTVVVGVVTGLLTVLIVYLVDRIDMFGVNEAERQEHVLTRLNSEMDRLFSRANVALAMV